MDRSVDSIGSCSLDVDADSTDFSDTSGELNFLTPNSAKDIQREFTAGIKERCKIPVINCQAVTTVLDPVTGNINTVLTTTSPQTETVTTPTAGVVPSKKPSYLNLACCVNGYSNLTTYDSKLRQDINKSREVSPSRPIIATLHYNRSDGGNFQLTAPTLSYISMNNSINNNISNGRIGGMMNGTGRVGGGGTGGQDVTDNASIFNGNGFGNGLRTKVISSQSQISSVKESEKVVKKSFIQQRVEKLYGNAEGVVINKQIYNSNERKYLNNIANENVSKNYSNAIHLNGNGNVATNGCSVGATTGGGVAGGGGGIGGGGGYCGGGGVTKENLDENNKEIADDLDMDALPVLRHLRPEFRAQLQIFSPKKVPKTSPNRSAAGVTINGNNNHIISNGDLSHHHSHSSPHLSNGHKVLLNDTSSSSTVTLSSSSSIHTTYSTVVESKQQEQHTTVTAATSSGTTTTTTTLNSSESHQKQKTRSDSEELLSVASAAVTTNTNSDATGPTTVANNASTAIRESRSAATTAVTAQAPVEKEPLCVEESVVVIEQHQQQPQKMKLNEPAVAVNGDGGDSGATTIIRNGTSGKNGHHPVDDDDKENINGDAVEVKTQSKDGNYFLQVLKNEQNRLLTMAADLEREADQLKTDGVEINEEIAGHVLVAAGKARLLCSQKMKQFEGLCYNNLNQIPGEKFQTTNGDLRGFWDMLLLQVDNVDASFAEIDSFRRNGWKKPTPASPTPQARNASRSTKLVKRPYKTPATNGSSPADGSAAEAKKAAAAAASAKREAQRKQLMELKRKQKLASGQPNVEIFVPGATITSAVTNVAGTNGVTATAVDAS